MKIVIAVWILAIIVLILLSIVEKEKYWECARLPVIEREYCMQYIYWIERTKSYKELLLEP